MVAGVPLVDVWRGGMIESQHFGHVVISDDSGQILEAWGDPNVIVYPRSSSKMIQALPLLESGAADLAGLQSEHLALACASHIGSARHTNTVAAWLASLGYADSDLRCGAHMPHEDHARDTLIRESKQPCQVHNMCSGKHAGFLTLARHLKSGPEYVDPNHPVQIACRAAFEEVTGQDSSQFGIDGCSAPNFATSLHAVARGMAFFANARNDDARSRSARRLWQAMVKHPHNVAGPGRACTQMMLASKEPAAIKTGAEGFYVAILPERGLGVALKIIDGATRASECTMAALLVKLGVLDARDPRIQSFLNPVIRNCRGIETGRIAPNPAFA